MEGNRRALLPEVQRETERCLLHIEGGTICDKQEEFGGRSLVPQVQCAKERRDTD